LFRHITSSNKTREKLYICSLINWIQTWHREIEGNKFLAQTESYALPRPKSVKYFTGDWTLWFIVEVIVTGIETSHRAYIKTFAFAIISRPQSHNCGSDFSSHNLPTDRAWELLKSTKEAENILALIEKIWALLDLNTFGVMSWLRKVRGFWSDVTVVWKNIKVAIFFFAINYAKKLIGRALEWPSSVFGWRRQWLPNSLLINSQVQWRLVVRLAGRAAKFHLWLNTWDYRPGCFYNIVAFPVLILSNS